MKRLLDSISSPHDLKKLSITELEELSAELRETICSVVSNNGGHLAPSLGVVELTIALHATLHCPEDKIVWDVGHQAYAHKILTGRLDRFPTIRTEGGLSGYPSITESEYDAFGTGHASTAISAALGLAAARDIRGSSEKVVAVIGDGSMTGGLAFEGLNNAGAEKRDIIVVLNDNKMAISPNVGALPRYLTNVISDQTYNKLKRDIWQLTGYLPAVGKPVRTVLNRLERSLKNLIVPGAWFENLGFRYFGPVDGHDINRLMQILLQLKPLKGPILLHVYTTKGKGYEFAELDAVRFHGVGAFEQTTGRSKKHADRPGYSEIFGETICELARTRPTICAITAAMTDSTGLLPFSQEFPNRFFDVGIAEGHAVTFAGGLVQGGMKPFVVLYSSFLQRSYDNIIHDIALQRLPVVICIDRAGFVGEDGPTHHGVFDLSFLRHIPNLTVLAPRDENELRDMLAFAADFTEGPVAIRYPRGSGTARRMRRHFRTITPGEAEILTEGDTAALLAVGEQVPVAEASAAILANEGLSLMVANMRSIVPLDTTLLDRIALMKMPVITLEENSIAGGFGSSVLEYYAGKQDAPSVTMIGIPPVFSPHATRSRLLERYGLTAEGVADRIRKVVRS